LRIIFQSIREQDAMNESRPGATGDGRTLPPELAIVIPARNERENLELLLPALRETLDGLGVTWEIVVVDGGSSDGTPEAATRRGARVVQQEARGYGAALLAGFAATAAPWIVTMDANCSHRPIFVEDRKSTRLNSSHIR
jgi:glycosyltransferase involved in cell wall biosynthesis